MQILGFIAQPLVLIILAIPLAILVGVLLGVYLSQPRHNLVIAVSTETGRGTEYEAIEEDAVTLRCNPVGNSPPQRFIKIYNAMNVTRKSFFKLQNFGLWLCRVGTAYVTPLGNPERTMTLHDAVQSLLGEESYGQFPEAVRNRIEMDTIVYKVGGSEEKVELKTTIENMFGKDMYKALKPELKEKIEEAKVGVTVRFPDTELTPHGYKSVSSDDVRRGDIDQFIKSIATGIANLMKEAGGMGGWTKNIFILGSGIAIGIAIVMLLGWGNKTIIQEPAKMILRLIFR